ncbi:MAG: hypothetical protein ABJF88_09615 [Rhodothermales bacterium]
MHPPVIFPNRFPVVATIALLASILTLTACDTADPGPNYTRALLTEYVQEAMPFADDAGRAWDETSGPDAVFVLMDANDQEVRRSETFADLSRADLPLRWSFLPRPEVTDFDASYYIALYDEDESGLTPVATTSRFTLREFAAAGFATTYTFENMTDTLSSRVEIRWEE